MTGGIAAAYVLTGRLKEGVALLERTIDASDKEEVKVRAPFRRTYCAEISPRPMKSRCACEWGGWGRLSDDGPGHYNPDPSEGPWGGGVMTSKAVRNRVHGPTQCGTTAVTMRCTKGERKPDGCRCTPGAGLNRQYFGEDAA